MDRQTVYAGQVPLETDLLNTNRNVLIAIGKMMSDMLGTSTYASGLGCVATAPASLSVQVQPGQLYALQNLDSTPYSSLAADTTHQIVKQGIALDAATLACPAPTTAGFSINYLIEANYADVDSNPVVLAYYNASNPSQAFSGPGNNGQPSMTTRAGKVVLTLKAGVAAATGTQITPAVDSGCIGLWVVTVANGQSTITAGNITQYAGAPILPTSLLQSLITNNLEYGIDNGSANVVQATFPLPPTAIVDNQQFWVKIKAANTGAATFTPNPGVIAAAPVVGGAHSALQGNEMVANGRALFVYRADITSYVLESCTGAALQVGTATQPQHAMQFGQATGRLLNVQTIAANSTYTPTPGMSFVISDLVGGGGGTGGAPATGSGQFSGSPGSSSGSYLRMLWTAAQIGASRSVTIGAGGAAGGSGSSTGGNGGATTVTGLASAPGGIGSSSFGPSGATLALAAPSSLAPNPTVTVGTVILSGRGSQGGPAIGGTTGGILAGTAGPSPIAGGAYGTGATGTAIGSSAGATVGFAGTGGVAVFYEFS